MKTTIKSKLKSVNWGEVGLGASAIAGTLGGLYLSVLLMSTIMGLSSLAGWMIIGGTVVGAIYGASNECPRPYGDKDRLPNAFLWGGICAGIAGAFAGLLAAGSATTTSWGAGYALLTLLLSSICLVPSAAVAGVLFVSLPAIGCMIGILLAAIISTRFFNR